jgi:hypothetical protein
MIIRTYRCEDCKELFDVTCGSNDGDPECPYCAKEMVWQPKRFSIGGSLTSAAVDVTQKILEQDYGQSNMGDSLREGDAAFKAPVMQTAERETIQRLENEYISQSQLVPAARDFFAGGNSKAPASIVQAAVADARSHKGKEPSPIDLLHKAGQRGELGTPFKTMKG